MLSVINCYNHFFTLHCQDTKFIPQGEHYRMYTMDAQTAEFYKVFTPWDMYVN